MSRRDDRRREDAARALGDWIRDTDTPEQDVGDAVAELLDRSRQEHDRGRDREL